MKKEADHIRRGDLELVPRVPTPSEIVCDFPSTLSEVEQSQRDYRFVVRLPKVARKNLLLEIVGEELQVTAETHEERLDDTSGISELAVTCYHKTIRFPEEVNWDSAEAYYADGELLVAIDRLRRGRPGTVDILKPEAA